MPTPKERHSMEHATGWLSAEPLYRNRFVTGPGSDDYQVIQHLIGQGLMRLARHASELSGGDQIFAVTDAGISALKAADFLEHWQVAKYLVPHLSRDAGWACALAPSLPADYAYAPGSRHNGIRGVCPIGHRTRASAEKHAAQLQRHRMKPGKKGKANV